MDTPEGFDMFKEHPKHNVYAVVWSAWMKKDTIQTILYSH